MKKKTSVLILLGVTGLISFLGLSTSIFVMFFFSSRYSIGLMGRLSRPVIPWYDICLFVSFLIGLIIAMIVILTTGTERTKVKAVVMVVVLELILIIGSLLGSVIPLLTDRAMTVAYSPIYSRMNSILAFARVIPSVLQSLLLFFSLGRYYELQDTEE